jgi:hypothetical protein
MPFDTYTVQRLDQLNCFALHIIVDINVALCGGDVRVPNQAG